ncbi:Citrate-binding protein [Apostasia shenzhenica]|uniref:Citrate-binding protein n=1 Tax=Apostasia shenzhenica TaxID=1088818 RepID=A0A2I0B148_9ASPA|nr:Citrate-binding protein [Apostasia shenzhenica]
MGSPSLSWFLLATFMACSSCLLDFPSVVAADPTDGFDPVPLTDSNLAFQKPYDVPLQKRYSFVDGVRRFWVYSNDKSYKPDSPTHPRTEIRIKGYDYSSGIWQFEGDLFVPQNTTGVAVMQIHRANGDEPATTLMLMVFDGELRFYSGSRVVESDIYNRWMKLNVIHDVVNNKHTIYIDGIQKLEVEGKGSDQDIIFLTLSAICHPSSNSLVWRDDQLILTEKILQQPFGVQHLRAGPTVTARHT